MQNIIIPSINCSDFECIKKRIALASSFKNDSSDNWVHVDVSDGKFTPHTSWNNPEELRELINENKVNTKIEVHLMIENPETQIEAWLRTGINRVIVHLEAMQDSVLILEKCKKYNVECFLAIKPDTEIERLLVYVDDFNGFLILGVMPGPSGQEMKKEIIEKIKFLRKSKLNLIIEVDGGVNLETAKLVKEAGANLFVAGNFIFSSENPSEAYKILEQAVL